MFRKYDESKLLTGEKKKSILSLSHGRPAPPDGAEAERIPMAENILDEILKIKDLLPKKQQKLCNYLALNYKQVGVMTVAELAQAAGVGTTTVMRLSSGPSKPVSTRQFSTMRPGTDRTASR